MMEYVVIYQDSDSINDLIKSLNSGVLLDNGKYKFVEKTIARINGLRVEIFSNEHFPPHFRVIDGEGNSNNYRIADCTPINGDSLNKYYNNIKAWHKKNKNKLIEEWNNSRPTDCPVGRIE